MLPVEKLRLRDEPTNIKAKTRPYFSEYYWYYVKPTIEPHVLLSCFFLSTTLTIIHIFLMKSNYQKHFETKLSKLTTNTDASFFIPYLGRALWLKPERSVYKFGKTNYHMRKRGKRPKTFPEQTEYPRSFSSP